MAASRSGDRGSPRSAASRYSGSSAFSCRSVLAALLVLAGVNTFRSSADVASERAELMSQIDDSEVRLASLEEEIRGLEADIQVLSERQVTDPQLRSRLELLAPLAGDVPVTGPGIVIEVGDNPYSR